MTRPTRGTLDAIRIGRTMAKGVLQRRARALRGRAAALAKRGPVPAAAAPLRPRLLAGAGAGPGAGVLVAEGDSWFDYPWADVLQLLEDDHGYDVESVAHPGDRVEDMAYGGGQLEAFTRRIEKVLRQGAVPKAILLSGGGNDVAGDEFGMLLNHAGSAIAGLSDDVVRSVIDDRVRLAYVTILSSVTAVCEQRVGRKVPIIVHGYDYPVPDGRGFLGGWSILPGPWLEPGFRAKGFSDRGECTLLAAQLIDRFNDMLRRLPGLPGLSHVRYVDLRKTLSTGADYKKLWANELHPTRRGWELVTARFAKELGSLP